MTKFVTSTTGSMLLRQPERAGAGNVDVFDHPAKVLRAAIRRQLDGEYLVMRRVYRSDLRLLELQPVQHGNLTGKPAETQAVSPIWCEVEIDNYIIQL
jgi:hypothetical protein